ncbi:hypothetical protein SAMN06269117_11329 [Balnearium lithotrophicum]|uniref:Uncharacterized protein n=1 Tax=Balnearium lithotrophicum TaxID=223788 RepID=A0A521CJC2_9BACT|nr:hypothetical protein SAMN06269117_11329 [Balnearium lithotrophicum]
MLILEILMALLILILGLAFIYFALPTEKKAH